MTFFRDTVAIFPGVSGDASAKPTSAEAERCRFPIAAGLHTAAPHAYAGFILSCQSAAPFCGVAGQLVIQYLSVTTQVDYRILESRRKVKAGSEFRDFAGKPSSILSILPKAGGGRGICKSAPSRALTSRAGYTKIEVSSGGRTSSPGWICACSTFHFLREMRKRL